MENIGLIKSELHNGKTYSLTEEGKKILYNKILLIKEIHVSAISLFEANEKY